MEIIPEEERAPTQQIPIGSGIEQIISNIPQSCLGLQWDPKEDVFTYSQYADLGEENLDTKTSVASLLAKLFDPIGLICPYVMSARKIMKNKPKLKA